MTPLQIAGLMIFIILSFVCWIWALIVIWDKKGFWLALALAAFSFFPIQIVSSLTGLVILILGSWLAYKKSNNKALFWLCLVTIVLGGWLWFSMASIILFQGTVGIL